MSNHENWIYQLVYYPLRAGQKILFQEKRGGVGLGVSAYATK